jgi:Protein of unknown function (DUF2800)
MSDEALTFAPIDPPVPPPTPEPERPHHPYSPSQLNSLEACPCYKSSNSGSTHERTIAGTKSHAMVEKGVDDSSVGDEDAAAVAECMDFVEHRKRLAEDAFAKAKGGWGGAVPPAGDVATFEFAEEYLPIDNLIFPDAQSTTAGYPDRVLVNWDMTYAEIFDWKFGRWPVEAAIENLQGWAYALGMFHKIPSLTAVRVFFRQPNIQLYSDGLFQRADIPKMYLRIKTVVARAREARLSATFETANPQTPVCLFCGNLGTCPKVLPLALKVGKKFHPIEIPDDVTPTGVAKDVDMLLKLSAVLSVWCGAVRRQITDRILRGELPVPAGQKIEQRTPREIVDMKKVREVALRHMPVGEFEALLECGIGKLEDVINEHAERGNKKESVKQFGIELESAGAVKRKESFSFLRGVAEK